MFDRVNIEIHFMRYLYLALFEDRGKTIFTVAELIDCSILVFAIIPAFVVALRFWTAPVYLNYKPKFNSFLVPLLVPLLFLAGHIDIMMLLCLVIYMNIYVFWYHIDPPQNTYLNSHHHKYKDTKIKEEVYKQ